MLETAIICCFMILLPKEAMAPEVEEAADLEADTTAEDMKEDMEMKQCQNFLTSLIVLQRRK